jgi:hypothetical protein
MGRRFLELTDLGFGTAGAAGGTRMMLGSSAGGSDPGCGMARPWSVGAGDSGAAVSGGAGSGGAVSDVAVSGVAGSGVDVVVIDWAGSASAGGASGSATGGSTVTVDRWIATVNSAVAAVGPLSAVRSGFG